MTPLSEAVIELRLVVSQAESVEPPANVCPDQFTWFIGTVFSDLVGAMERVDPGLGARLLLLMRKHAIAQGAQR